MTRPFVRRALAGIVSLLCAAGATAARASSFVNFESGQVRPLAMSADGSALYAVNTPDNRLEVFSLASGSPVHAASVEVGLEPVAVAVRAPGEVWVVNHLSDSVSIVDVAASPPRVTRTLLVGDEPRDVVFAGPGGSRAFVTTARRGQNLPAGEDPQFAAEGLGRADVWVFDTGALGAPFGGTPLTIVTLFGDTPRALAATPDGTRVYAAVFHSGNRTTTVTEGAVCNGGAAAAACMVGGLQMPGGLPAPNTNHEGVQGPETGLVVKFDSIAGQWRDPLGRNWNNAVKFNLPDLDVFAIDAMANPPVETESFAGVGTILFDMIVNPANGKVYVSNTEARNEVRFEGPGETSTTVQGHLHEARITVIDGGLVSPRHLNKHIDYAQLPSPAGTKRLSLATPLGMAITGDGSRLYVAAFGSSRVAFYPTSQLDADTFQPRAKRTIKVSGGGPTGLALDEPRGRLYVLTRFDNSLSVIDVAAKSEIAHLPLYSPEPQLVVEGRPFLYDARKTSSNGEASCSSCHVFGDLDSLAWDLGNPDDDVLANNNLPGVITGGNTPFHPLKGPMTTQSLRGMDTHGPMHWRGDRSGANEPGANANDSLDEAAGFTRFNPAFVGLIGRGSELAAADMQAFTDFILTVTYPPNPIRSLDNVLSASQQAGHDLYFGRATDTVANCDGCHELNPAQGFFGSNARFTFENETQQFKVAHLRNAYTKVGMFGFPNVPFINPGNNGNLGDQIRGYGYLHDGSIDTLFRFLSASVFNLSDSEKTNLQNFVLAYDSNLAPVVGQQVTRGPTSTLKTDKRIELFRARAAAGECDLVVKGNLAGEQRGWVRLVDGKFRSDRAAEPLVGWAALRKQSKIAGQERTLTCVPPGSGERIGIDRDEDGFLDRDELDAGSDPADPSSMPG